MKNGGNKREKVGELGKSMPKILFMIHFFTLKVRKIFTS